MITEYRRIKNFQQQDPYKGFEFSKEPTGKNYKYEFFYSKFDKPEEHIVRENMRHSIKFLKDRKSNLNRSLAEARKIKEPERDLILMSDIKQAEERLSQVQKRRSQSTQNERRNRYSLEKENLGISENDKNDKNNRELSTPVRQYVSEVVEGKKGDQLPKLDCSSSQKIEKIEKNFDINNFKKDVKSSIIYRYRHHKPSFDEFYQERRSISQSRGKNRKINFQKE